MILSKRRFLRRSRAQKEALCENRQIYLLESKDFLQFPGNNGINTMVIAPEKYL